MAPRRIPEATVTRLPLYLRALDELEEPMVSSERLAELAGVNAAKVRKDLSFLGSYGTRGVGYDVAFLRHQMSRELGLTRDRPVVVVGAGNLGRALANHASFAERGFPVAAVVDSDPTKVGLVVGGTVVRPQTDLADIVTTLGGAVGLLAVPASAAQAAADELVGAGVVSILNFAPVVLNVPRHVSVRQVDLAAELQILSFHERRGRPKRNATDGARDQGDEVASA